MYLGKRAQGIGIHTQRTTTVQQIHTTKRTIVNVTVMINLKHETKVGNNLKLTTYGCGTTNNTVISLTKESGVLVICDKPCKKRVEKAIADGRMRVTTAPRAGQRVGDAILTEPRGDKCGDKCLPERGVDERRVNQGHPSMLILRYDLGTYRQVKPGVVDLIIVGPPKQTRHFSGTRRDIATLDQERERSGAMFNGRKVRTQSGESSIISRRYVSRVRAFRHRLDLNEVSDLRVGCLHKHAAVQLLVSKTQLPLSC